MIRNLKKYLHIYGGFVSTSFSESMSFRVHFFLLIVMDLFFYLSAFMALEIIYGHVETVGIWRKEQLMFFLAFMLSINQLTMTLSSEGYWRFPEMLKKGDLDFFLIKPVAGIFIIFFRYVRPGSMFNVLFTLPALVYFGLEVGLSPVSWVLLPFLLVMGYLLQSAIDLMMASLMFWMLEGTGMNFVRMELQQLARWPDFIYPRVFRNLLTFGLPVLLIGSAPVRFLLDLHDFAPAIAMLVALMVCWGILSVLWRLGLRAYESASS